MSEMLSTFSPQWNGVTKSLTFHNKQLWATLPQESMCESTVTPRLWPLNLCNPFASCRCCHDNKTSRMSAANPRRPGWRDFEKAFGGGKPAQTGVGFQPSKGTLTREKRAHMKSPMPAWMSFGLLLIVAKLRYVIPVISPAPSVQSHCVAGLGQREALMGSTLRVVQ